MNSVSAWCAVLFAVLTVNHGLSISAWAEDKPEPDDATKELLKGTAEQPIDKEMLAKRRPNVYLTTFMNGYAGDTLPKEPERFEQLLVTIRDEGNFSAILCQYSEEREALCRKHGIRMVVDLLAFPHIYRNPLECKELLGKLQGNPTVAAFHLWSDRVGGQGAGRTRDINNCHRWDPTHATLCGTYSGRDFECLAKSDFVSNYNFSWKRGPHKNFRDLLGAWKVAKTHDTRLGRYLTTDAGLPGKGNPNRLLYIQNTSIAFGLRACLWHIGSRIMDMKSLQFNQYGKDVSAVNAWTKPMWREIPKLGLPEAIYSTPWTIDWNHREVERAEGQVVYPPCLDKYPFPESSWIQPVNGEFVMSMGKYEGTADYAYLANHDAYAEQQVVLKLTKAVRPTIFNRQTQKYENLAATDGTIAIKLDPGGGALLLFR